MSKGFITMRTQEIGRLEIIQKIIEKRLKYKQAALMLGITIRQIKRLVRNYKMKGAIGLVSKIRRPCYGELIQIDLRSRNVGFLIFKSLIFSEMINIPDNAVKIQALCDF